MTIVHEDTQGLFVRAGGYKARPGAVSHLAHAFRMDAGGVKKGDTVKARHCAGTQLIVLTLPDNTKTRWHIESAERDRNLCLVSNYKWDKNGLRVFEDN